MKVFQGVNQLLNFIQHTPFLYDTLFAFPGLLRILTIVRIASRNLFRHLLNFPSAENQVYLDDY